MTFAELFADAKRFFALPDELKAAISVRNTPHYRGYVAPGEESTNGRLDLKESWEFGREARRPQRAQGRGPFRNPW